jgi:hypothetical protein
MHVCFFESGASSSENCWQELPSHDFLIIFIGWTTSIYSSEQSVGFARKNLTIWLHSHHHGHSGKYSKQSASTRWKYFCVMFHMLLEKHQVPRARNRLIHVTKCSLELDMVQTSQPVHRCTDNIFQLSSKLSLQLRLKSRKIHTSRMLTNSYTMSFQCNSMSSIHCATFPWFIANHIVCKQRGKDWHFHSDNCVFSFFSRQFHPLWWSLFYII